MKIGIGVTTYKRPQHLELFHRQIGLTTENEFNYFVADDSKNRKGIAYRKNECLIALSDSDYIFLFDDDCFPIKTGWTDFFIRAHKFSGIHHFLYLKNTPSIKCFYSETIALPENGETYEERVKEKSQFITIDSYNNCAGCFIFLTQRVLSKVGGFNKDYGYYGFEHAGYSNRIHDAGLTKIGKYLSVRGTGEYVYSMDYDFHRRDEFQNKVNHIPSMSIKEMLSQSFFNKGIYEKDINQIYQPLL